MPTPKRPRRSLLYVPGDSRRKIEKAAASHADSIILDLEDGIAPERRDEAMTVISDALQTLDFGASERIVRLGGHEFNGEVGARWLLCGPTAFCCPRWNTPNR